MGENVLFGPASQIERGAGRQKIETGLREIQPSFADQHGFKAFLDGMQVQHIGGRILQLRIAQRFRAPVGALLGLGQVNACDFAGDILQPMPVGIGPRQFGGDLGAPDRRAIHAQPALDHADVKPRKVEQLDNLGVCQQGLQVRAIIIPAELNQVRRAVTGRQLHQCEVIAQRVEAHGFGIDGNNRAEIDIFGQVALMQLDSVHDQRFSMASVKGK